MQSTKEYQGTLEVFYKEMISELDKKYFFFSEKLNIQKENLKILFKKKLIDLVKLSTSINTQSDEGKSKEELSKTANTLKQQILNLISNMESMETYVSQINTKKNDEFIQINENNFTLIDTHFGISQKSAYNIDDKAEINDAFKNKSIECIYCSSQLVWGTNYDHFNKCTISNRCNSNYRYNCLSCLQRFCTNCKYPQNIQRCGCLEVLVNLQTWGQNCELCYGNIEHGWKCWDCDYDICDTCYNTK
jgi:hypothetical protein